MRRLAFDQFEYVAVALVGLAAVIGVVAYLSLHHDTRASGRPFPTIPSESGLVKPYVPPCRTAGADPTTCATHAAVLTFAGQTQPLSVAGLDARLTSVQVIPAKTASGRRRDRVRIAVDLQARNTGNALLLNDTDPVYAVIDGQRIAPDPVALRQGGAFALDTPLAPGQGRKGELHFEIGGATTAAFERSGAQIGLQTTDATKHQPAQVGVFRLAASNPGR